MLIPNDKKGWYGCFSEIGRRAASQNLILTRESSSSDLRNRFSQNEEKKNINIDLFNRKDDEINLDIFSIDEIDRIKLDLLIKNPIFKANFKTQNNKTNLFNQNDNAKRFYYYHLHRIKKDKIIDRGNPPCTKYNPKYTSIFKRTASSPSWNTMKGRKELFESKVEQHPFYLEHKNILDTMAGKSFINLKKQKKLKKNKYSNTNSLFTLKRNSSAIITPMNKIRKYNLSTINKNRKRPYSGINTRIRRENYSSNLRYNLESNSIEYKSEIKNRSRIKSSKERKRIIDKATNLDRNKIIKLDYDKSTEIKINNSGSNRSKSDMRKDNTKESLNTSRDSYESYKHFYKNKIKKKVNNINDILFTKEFIKAPDFNAMLSRESLAKLIDDKIPVVPYLLPNFSSVRDRPLTMVVYDRKYHKINRNKSDSLLRIDNTFYYDPNDVLSKINNHTSIHAPDFKLMSSRPDDDDPLPSYMKQLYSRNGCYNITQLSLKLNNYKNRGFAKVHSSFFPKKSFNKIVNLNLLKSKKFLNTIIKDKNVFYRQFKGLGNSLKFYNKNYEDILKDNLLEKFDNITFKTIKKGHSKKIMELTNKIKKETGEG